VIVGYRPGRAGVPRVLVATVKDGVLRYAGQLRLPCGVQAGVELARRLAARRRLRPLVRCPAGACGVEPELYCRVRFQGWTAQGHLRNAVFCGWLDATA
jgi:ATP-dependent DNA ligase